MASTTPSIIKDSMDMDTNKCPNCGAPFETDADGIQEFSCGTEAFESGAAPCISSYCRERAAHAETKKQYMELIMAVARKFDGETRHQTALRYINHAEDLAREAGKADAAMNRLDAEANGCQR